MVPWDVLVVVLGVAGLGVTEPVLCAMAIPTDSANTDVASKILRIETAPCELACPGFPDTKCESLKTFG